jgi:alpha-1,6-mannosyltransferase
VQLANLVTPTSGGLRTVVEQLGRGYVERGHRRVVVLPGRHRSTEVAADGHLRVTLPGRRVPGVAGRAGYRVMVDQGQLRELLARLRPDAVEVHDRFTLPWVARWARARGVPATVVVHERLDTVLAAAPVVGHLDPHTRRQLERWGDARLLDVAGRVVVASRWLADLIDDPRVVHVPFGIDLRDHDTADAEVVRDPEVVRDAEVVRDPDRDPRTVRLVTVGRLSAEKRPELAIEAVRVLAATHPVWLRVLGTGPDEAALRRRAQGLPVSFHGHLAPAAVRRHLVAADVALQPCPVETFGLAVLEALAAGTPVVVPAAGAAPELLGLRAGQRATTAAGAATAPTPAGLAAGVRELLARPPDDRRRAARDRARQRPLDACVEAFLALHGAPAPVRVLDAVGAR